MDAPDNNNKRTRHHYELEDIERFVRSNVYPVGVDDWGKKSNFKRAAKNFSIFNGIFTYNKNRVVVFERKRQLEIIKDIHEGLGDSEAAKALASHYGHGATYDKKLIWAKFERF